jgi:hypothetical protein
MRSSIRIFRLLVVTVITFISCTLHSQINFFMEISGNYMLLRTQEGDPDPLPVNNYLPGFYPINQPEYIAVENFNSKPAFNVNLGISKSLFQKFSMEAGLGVSQMNFRRTISIEELNEQEENIPDNTPELFGVEIIFTDYDSLVTEDRTYIGGTSENAGKTRITYLTLPIRFCFSPLERLSVGIGITPSVVLYSSQIFTNTNITYKYSDVPIMYWSEDTLYGSREIVVETQEYEDRSSNGFTNVLWSGTVSINYNLFHKLWVSAQYQHSFTPIYDENRRYAGDAKYRTITLGLKYYFP